MSPILELPQELRDRIFDLVLEDASVFVMNGSCACRRSLFEEGSLLRVRYHEGPSDISSTQSYEIQYLVCSTVFAVNRQLRADSISALRRLRSRQILLSTSTVRAMKFIHECSSEPRDRITQIFLADECSCHPFERDPLLLPLERPSGGPLTQSELASKWCAAYVDRLPSLRHVTLLVPTSMVMVRRDLRRLYQKFFEPLQEGRLEQITVILGYSHTSHYEPDLDYEQSWLLGRPRTSVPPDEPYHDYFARLRAKHEWLDISVERWRNSKINYFGVPGARLIFRIRRNAL
ncbi:hypothetical protein NA57DRAFT_79468 [Rhizodiscina lignyota]|uniref:F-box domain-containing protein n=1 Tax=Rhizodiscina lignyota TaxID=1504668 RepID=A0A9P4I861_9PEZI|nr:hypothetical protein NA57DRAFT_79468 [Rhizodiscina lignyota]